MPLFVFNGTGANTMALQLMTRPYHIIFCAETAHIAVDECGAPAKATGCTVRQIMTYDGKLAPVMLEEYMTNFGVEHHSQPGVIYISQCTEYGTIYTPREVREICHFAHENGMMVHMDGARLANAAAALDLSLDDLSGACGVDSLTLGGTKNGLMGGECVVLFNQDLFEEARYARKQSCQLASKMRFISSQFIAYFHRELWRDLAYHSNVMARRLYDELVKVPGIKFTQKVESNQLFLIMPRGVEIELLKEFHFYFWNNEKDEIRFVTSYNTTKDDIELLVATIKRLMYK